MSAFITLLEKLSLKVAALDGWRRAGTSFLAGVAAVLALPPLHAVFMLIPSFAVLMWMIDSDVRSGRWSAAFAGWWFGLGYFVAGLYWISFSFLVDAATFAWMIPFAVTGIAAVLAIYIALAAALTRWWVPKGPWRIVAFAGFWIILEWVRSWALTGFPWNLLGSVWTFSDAMIQGAAIGGTYLLSLMTVIAAAMPAILARGALRPRIRWAWSMAPMLVLLAASGAGQARLSAGTTETVDDVRLRLIQPNIAQRDKWKPDLLGRHLGRLLTMSKQPVDGGAKQKPPTHVIWPETAVPFFLSGSREGISAVSSAIPDGGVLVTGALRVSSGVAVTPGSRPQLWNSLAVITSDERIAASYDKHHLVPFGEYVPLKNLLRIGKLTAGRTDFSAGAGPRTVALQGAPAFSPLICYEAIFPHRAVDRDARPGWILNLTNDAWFGVSSGPYQHFASTRLRAVEEGLPLIRVANTGLSGIVDSYGRIVSRTKLNQAAVLDGVLPVALPPTIYAVWGNILPLGLALFLLVVSRFVGLVSQP